jgi:hypothetical protein
MSRTVCPVRSTTRPHATDGTIPRWGVGNPKCSESTPAKLQKTQFLVKKFPSLA